MIYLPLAFSFSLLNKTKTTKTEDFFSFHINNKNKKEQILLLKELGSSNILYDLYLNDINSLQEDLSFIKENQGLKLTINIIKDKEYKDFELLKKDLTLIFSSFKSLCINFKISLLPNKIYNAKEYEELYTLAYEIKTSKFKDFKLIGPSTNDFDLNDITQTLFSKKNIFFDKVCFSLCDNKLSFPEEKKTFSLNIEKLINITHALSTLAIKAKSTMLISNISYDAKDEQKQANHLVRYYLLAFASKRVDQAFCENLIDEKMGLTYLQNNEVIKRKSFYALKTMIHLLQGSKVEKYTQASGLHVLTLLDKNKRKLDVVWVQGEGSVELTESKIVLDMYEKKIKGDIRITNSPIYAYH